MNGYKLLMTPTGHADGDAEDALRDWARGLAATLGDVRRIELDLRDVEGNAVHEAATPSSYPDGGWSAIVSLWAAAPPVSPPSGHAMTVLTVADRIGYGFEDDRPGPVAGYKKFSMWQARAGVPRETWDPLYAHHIVTVPTLQPIWRYRQNIVVGKPDDMPYDAISENWWATLHALGGGYFMSEDARHAVYEETARFVDFDVNTNFVSRNEVLFIG